MLKCHVPKWPSCNYLSYDTNKTSSIPVYNARFNKYIILLVPRRSRPPCCLQTTKFRFGQVHVRHTYDIWRRTYVRRTTCVVVRMWYAPRTYSTSGVSRPKGYISPGWPAIQGSVDWEQSWAPGFPGFPVLHQPAASSEQRAASDQGLPSVTSCYQELPSRGISQSRYVFNLCEHECEAPLLPNTRCL